MKLPIDPDCKPLYNISPYKRVEDIRRPNIKKRVEPEYVITWDLGKQDMNVVFLITSEGFFEIDNTGTISKIR